MRFVIQVSKNAKVEVDGKVCGQIGQGLTILIGVGRDDSREIADFLRAQTGLFLSNGVQYGTGGEHHLRMNIACPRVMCGDGVQRLLKGLQAWKALHRE